MNHITVVFTRSQNLLYFEKCLEYWCKARARILEKFPSLHSSLYVLDFGEIPSAQIEKITRYYLRTQHAYGEYGDFPKRGFCGNMNTALQFIQAISLYQHDYMVSINDDAMISENFLLNGIGILEDHSRVGFLGGIPNKGKWLTPLKNIKIPEETDLIFEKVNPLDRLHWEGSAGIYRTKALRKIGKWDEAFDVNGGVCSDNDYFLRMWQAGYWVWRSGKMPFFHCKGVSQSDYRNPIPGRSDPLKQANLAYFHRKWNILLESGEEPHPYDTPFNICPPSPILTEKSSD